MKKIFSKIKKKKLLHILFRPPKKNKRINISPKNEFLQVGLLNMNKGKKILPHKHFWKKNIEKKRIVQESWIIISGSAKVSFYDINDKFLTSKILKPGDISITFEGGHKMDILKKNTKIYEYKTGPYEGPKKDLKYF